jgi:hypothetical protein
MAPSCFHRLLNARRDIYLLGRKLLDLKRGSLLYEAIWITTPPMALEGRRGSEGHCGRETNRAAVTAPWHVFFIRLISSR